MMPNPDAQIIEVRGKSIALVWLNDTGVVAQLVLSNAHTKGYACAFIDPSSDLTISFSSPQYKGG